MDTTLSTYPDQHDRVRRFFDSAESWKGRMYSDGTDRFDKAMLRRKEYLFAMLNNVRTLNPGRSLDIGCGCGIYSKQLAEMGFETYGVDVSAEMIETCRNTLSIPESEFPKRFMTAGAEQLPFRTGMFDLVIAVGVFGYLMNDDEALQEIMRVIKPGGLFFLSVQNIVSLSNADYAFRQMVKNRFRGIRNATALPVPWVTSHTSTGLFYKSYFPWKLKKAVTALRCSVVDEMSLGYEFRLIRRLRLANDALLVRCEEILERLTQFAPFPPWKYAGDTYSVLFQKNV